MKHKSNLMKRDQRKSFYVFISFWLVGFLATVIFFLTFWVLPHTGIPSFITILAGIGLAVLIIWLVLRMSGNGSAWANRHRLALVSGSLSLFILLTPVHEFVTSRADNTTGMTLVGLAALIFLLWLRWRVKRHSVETSQSTE